MSIFDDVEWVTCTQHPDTLESNVGEFTISRHPIQLRHLDEFLQDTGYTPELERGKRQGFFRDFFVLNFEDNPLFAVYGVSYEDARAFCDWAGVRLPTDSELGKFFQFAVENSIEMAYAGPCWTSTRCDGSGIIVRDGPYRKSELDQQNETPFRRCIGESEFSEELTCFRVVRELA